jgi:lysophospholipase L1-like esterase
MWIKKYQDWNRVFEDKKSGYYTYPTLPDSIYRKLPSGGWQVKRPELSKFVELTQGDVEERKENLETRAQDKVLNLLFVGDSNTASAAGGKFYGWWAGQRLNADVSQPRVTVDRVAKGGEGTTWMIDNLRTRLSQKGANYYDIITILGGSNDIWGGDHDAEYVKTNIQTLVQMATDHGARAVVISPPSKELYVQKKKEDPAVPKKEKTSQENKLNELAKLVKWETDTYGDNFINFNWITSPGGGARIEDFESDVRHLKPEPKHKELGDLWIYKIFWGSGPV